MVSVLYKLLSAAKLKVKPFLGNGSVTSSVSLLMSNCPTYTI